MQIGRFILIITSIALVSARLAFSQCTLVSDAGVLKTSIKKAAKCNDKALRSGPDSECKQTAPPQCAGTLVTDSIHLAYGSNNPPSFSVNEKALEAQLECQEQISDGVTKYVWKKMQYLAEGMDPAKAEAKARKKLDKIPEICEVQVTQDVSGVILPSVGPQCTAAIGAPGSTVNTVGLRDCLHTLVEVWVDRFGPNPKPLRPNIVFILSDDQRWDTTDSKHSPSGTDVMPHLRTELAASGVEFNNAYMTTPLCCPSRTSTLTGQYSHTTGIHTNQPPNGGAQDFVDASTIGVWLQSAGYRTGFFGKYLNGYNQLWQQGEPPYIPPGWSEWHGMKNVAFFNYVIVENGIEISYGSTEAEYSTDVLRDKAMSFIDESVTAGQPFFLYFAPKAPHLPATPAPRHAGSFAGLAPWRPESYNETDVSDKPLWVQNTPLMAPAEQADLDANRITMLESLQAIDEAVAAIMQNLRDHNMADNTIVVYFSDNGWLWGEHRMKAKNKTYEEAVRSPMLVRYPKLIPLARKENLYALNIDFAPTFAELAGIIPPSPVDGRSLLHVFDGTEPAWRTDFMIEGWAKQAPFASIHEGDWKYTEYATGEIELYNLSMDPLEQSNVASDPANASRAAAMAVRVREIRPAWPTDAGGLDEDPDE